MNSDSSCARTALIVDDQRFNRTLLRASLASLDYTTTDATDGSEAIEQLNRQAFSVVFLDWELPGELKGGDVLRHVRVQPAHASTLVIAITSNTSDAMKAHCEAAGTDAFLGKALDPESVRNALSRAATVRPTRASRASEEWSRADTGAELTSPEHVATMPTRIREQLTIFSLEFPGGMPEALRFCQSEILAEQTRIHAAAAAMLWTDAARAAHNLGSLFAIVGLPEFHQAMRPCETSLRGEPGASIKDVLGQIDIFVASVCAALEET
ncbi:MAG: response regulator [Rariglobus sp.]